MDPTRSCKDPIGSHRIFTKDSCTDVDSDLLEFVVYESAKMVTGVVKAQVDKI